MAPTTVIFFDTLRARVCLHSDEERALFQEGETYSYEQLSVKQRQALSYYQDKATRLLALYEAALPRRAEYPELWEHVKELVVYERGMYDCHCLPLLQHYGVTSTEMFVTLATTRPFGCGKRDHDSVLMLDLEREWEKMADEARQRQSTHVFLDYWNGIGFKLGIPVNIQAVDEKQANEYRIDYSRYDDRNSVPCLVKLLRLVASKAVAPPMTDAVICIPDSATSVTEKRSCCVQ